MKILFLFSCVFMFPFLLLAQAEEAEPDTSYQYLFGEAFILGDSLIQMAQSDSGSILSDSVSFLAQFEADFYLSDSIFPDFGSYKTNVFSERLLRQPPSLVSVKIEELVDYSLTFVGLPYRFGGTSENGFDCSGFVRYVYGKYGRELPRSSREQVHIGSTIALSEVQKGDLLFFKGRNSRSSYIGHVAMVIEVSPDGKDVKMIHSTRHGLRADWLSQEPYYVKRYVTARRPGLNPP